MTTVGRSADRLVGALATLALLALIVAGACLMFLAWWDAEINAWNRSVALSNAINRAAEQGASWADPRRRPAEYVGGGFCEVLPPEADGSPQRIRPRRPALSCLVSSPTSGEGCGLGWLTQRCASVRVPIRLYEVKRAAADEGIVDPCAWLATYYGWPEIASDWAALGCNKPLAAKRSSVVLLLQDEESAVEARKLFPVE